MDRNRFRFKYDGKEWELNFSREHKTLTHVLLSTELGAVETEVLSDKPYTTVKILEVDETKPHGQWIVFREATVGCWHKDNHSKDKGREHALRLVMKTMPPARRDKKGVVIKEAMHVPMWTCYTRRRQVQSIRDRRASLTAQLQALEKLEDNA